MQKAPGSTALFALAIPLAAGCGAATPDYLTAEKVSVPFGAIRPGGDPVAPYRELRERLKRKAAAEAGDSRFPAAVSVIPVGRGELDLVAAITPSRGIFYLAKAGPYRPDNGSTIDVPHGSLEICRFTLAWDRLPGGAYAPGPIWMGDSVPGPDCKRPDPGEPAQAAEWHGRSAEAAYSVVGRGTEAGLRVAVVRETWPRWPGWPRTHPLQPFDGGRAVEAVAREKVVRAVPADLAQPSFRAESASGRTFIGLPSRSGGSDTMCIVEGLDWADIAAPFGVRSSAARALCERLADGPRVVPAPGEARRSVSKIKAP